MCIDIERLKINIIVIIKQGHFHRRSSDKEPKLHVDVAAALQSLLVFGLEPELVLNALLSGNFSAEHTLDIKIRFISGF